MAGIARETAWKARKRDPAFTEAWDAAMEDARDLLEIEARRRVVQGVGRPVLHQRHKVGAVRGYSATLLIFLFKGGRPEKYRERFERSGPGGKTVPFQVIDGLLSRARSVVARQVDELRQNRRRHTIAPVILTSQSRFREQGLREITARSRVCVEIRTSLVWADLAGGSRRE